MTRFMTTGEKMLFGIIAIAAALFALWSFTGITPSAMGKGGPPVFVTICHAAGLANEPANWVTLTLPENAVYGQAGHFNENGTTQAGHEQDYLGACEEEEEPPVECPNGDLNGDAEGCDAVVVPPPSPPRVCPDGLPPTPGEGAFDPNDDCKRPPVEEEPSTPTDPTPPVTPEAPDSPESPSPSVPEAPAAPSVETPDFQEGLEKDAAKQAEKNGATSAPSATSTTPATEALPHTGLALNLAVLLGLLALTTGLWLRGDLSRMWRRLRA